LGNGAFCEQKWRIRGKIYENWNFYIIKMNLFHKFFGPKRQEYGMKTNRFLLAAVLAALAFTFFGCSSDGGDDDGGGGNSSSGGSTVSSSSVGGGNVGNAVGTWKAQGTFEVDGITMIVNTTLVLKPDGTAIETWTETLWG
jgi:hypothetical protein